MTKKDNFTYNLLYALVWLLSLLPLRMLYVLSDLLYIILSQLLKYRRNVIRQNLQMVFPNKTREEKLSIERNFYRHLCDVMVETLKIPHLSNKELLCRMDFRNIDSLNTTLLSGTPVMAMLGHYGNWEWIQEVSARVDSSIVMGEVYRPQISALANRLIKKIRSRWDTVLMTQKETLRTIISMRQKAQPFCIGFTADQRPNGVVLNNWIKFLGQDTAYVTGAENIGRKIGAAYYYFDVSKPKRGHYVIDIIPIKPNVDNKEEFPYSATYMWMMEQTILRQPELWLWSHKRWILPSYSKIIRS